LLSKEQWNNLSYYKTHFPIWGVDINNISSNATITKNISRINDNLDLTYEGGQINWKVREYLKKNL
jgi:hypothetical protein